MELGSQSSSIEHVAPPSTHVQTVVSSQHSAVDSRLARLAFRPSTISADADGSSHESKHATAARMPDGVRVVSKQRCGVHQRAVFLRVTRAAWTSVSVLISEECGAGRGCQTRDGQRACRCSRETTVFGISTWPRRNKRGRVTKNVRFASSARRPARWADRPTSSCDGVGATEGENFRGGRRLVSRVSDRNDAFARWASADREGISFDPCPAAVGAGWMP